MKSIVATAQVPSHRPHAPPGGWRTWAVAGAAATLLAVAGSVGQVTADRSARAARASELSMRSLPMLAPQALKPTQASADFKAFALNVLLGPLLDDELPSRWADPSVSVDCEHARVTIDGVVPDIGAPVPRVAFTLRWQMDHCDPLDGYFDLSGAVDIRVEPGPGGYTAVVRPVGLRVASTEGVDVLSEPFTARLDVGR